MTVPLLAATGLVKHFVASRSLLGRPARTVRAVDGVSLEVMPGETVALVGESGCGKSTIGRLILRLVEPTAGTVRFAGADVSELRGAELRAFRARAQIIFQDPYASLNPRMTVGDMLVEPLLLHKVMTAAAQRDRVGQLLALVGLDPGYARRYPHEFSGGQRQRIAIARALAPEPKLIVCDEPVSALDVSIRAQILNLLADLQRRLGLAYVFISHDLSVVKHIADRVMVMYLGRIVETAPTDALFASPRHPYTQALMSAIPLPSARAGRRRRLLPGDPPSPTAPPAGCHLHPRCPHAEARCSAARPELEELMAGHRVACLKSGEIALDRGSLPAEAETPAHLKRLLAAFEAHALE